MLRSLVHLIVYDHGKEGKRKQKNENSRYGDDQLQARPQIADLNAVRSGLRDEQDRQASRLFVARNRQALQRLKYCTIVMNYGKKKRLWRTPHKKKAQQWTNIHHTPHLLTGKTRHGKRFMVEHQGCSLMVSRQMRVPGRTVQDHSIWSPYWPGKSGGAWLCRLVTIKRKKNKTKRRPGCSAPKTISASDTFAHRNIRV